MFLSLLFSLYSTILVFFCVIHNPIYCSLLLVANSLLLSSAAYLLLGFCWYSLLFSIVYFGGVYIILLFVSAHVQNDRVHIISKQCIAILVVIFICMVVGLEELNILAVLGDNSDLLCCELGTKSYIVLAFSLLLVFGAVSTISLGVDDFIR